MHPILMDIFTRPVGWLAIGGSLAGMHAAGTLILEAQ